MNKEIVALEEEKIKAFEKACSVTSKPSDDKVQTGRKNSSEDRFINFAKYSIMINNRIDELYAIKKEILQAINNVDDGTYRTLLIERYIQFKTWEQIAVDMNYCYKHIVHTLHPKSLKLIKEVTECNITL